MLKAFREQYALAREGGEAIPRAIKGLWRQVPDTITLIQVLARPHEIDRKIGQNTRRSLGSMLNKVVKRSNNRPERGYPHTVSKRSAIGQLNRAQADIAYQRRTWWQKLTGAI